MNAWDALAGLLLAAEAGGRCNDFLADDGLTKGNLRRRRHAGDRRPADGGGGSWRS